MTKEEFLADIETFMVEADMRPSRFGMDALGDPSFVKQLREGRSCTMDTVARVRKFMDGHREAAGAAE